MTAEVDYVASKALLTVTMSNWSSLTAQWTQRLLNLQTLNLWLQEQTRFSSSAVNICLCYFSTNSAVDWFDLVIHLSFSLYLVIIANSLVAFCPTAWEPLLKCGFCNKLVSLKGAMQRLWTYSCRWTNARSDRLRSVRNVKWKERHSWTLPQCSVCACVDTMVTGCRSVLCHVALMWVCLWHLMSWNAYIMVSSQSLFLF